jgi:selenocysteine lyase/cysteine desulfurase
VVEALYAHGINTTATLREYAVYDMDEKAAGSALRISPHYYNTESELDRFTDALGGLLA